MTQSLDYFLALSDIHAGHPKTPASELYQQLQCNVYPLITDKCRIIILAGDIFDNLLSMNTESASVAISFIADLIEYARKYNILIRVIRGTITHDQNQFSKVLTALCRKDDDLIRYFDRIEIEHIERENLNVLYLPDDLPFKSAASVIEHVKQLMQSSNIDKINMVIGHGYFKHVLPESEKCHNFIIYDVDMFKDIVDGPIIMGHVHTPSVYRNVIYLGSFNRLKHGEEENKGFTILYRNKSEGRKLPRTSEWSYKFVKNEMATLFYTVTAYGDIENSEQILDKLVDDVSKLFKNKTGYLRIFVDNMEMKKLISSKTGRLFPQCIVTIEIKSFDEDEDKAPLDASLFESISFEQSPNRESLASDILTHIRTHKPGTKLTIELIDEKLSMLEG